MLIIFFNSFCKNDLNFIELIVSLFELTGGDKRQSSAGQTPSSSSATSIQSDDDAQRWHTVSAYVGGEISMPCAIDVAGCGRIYFITWTKNGSTILAETGSTTSSPKGSISKNGDWQRVFIHSDTFEKVLGDLDQLGPPGRVRFGPKDKLNTTSFAYLTVQSVTSQDEGVYKCDVTYTTPHAHGKCPSLTYTRVQTLGKFTLKPLFLPFIQCSLFTILYFFSFKILFRLKMTFIVLCKIR